MNINQWYDHPKEHHLLKITQECKCFNRIYIGLVHKSCRTRTLSLLTYRWWLTLECAMLVVFSVTLAVDWGFSSTSTLMSSFWISVGRLERSKSWTEKFHHRNCHFLSRRRTDFSCCFEPIFAVSEEKKHKFSLVEMNLGDELNQYFKYILYMQIFKQY